ncbi:MAG: hypothetical protein IH805_08055 [Proteobacteria bacterium]|nr:hypothetical protein [Pseudomonadota bacterium]
MIDSRGVGVVERVVVRPEDELVLADRDDVQPGRRAIAQTLVIEGQVADADDGVTPGRVARADGSRVIAQALEVRLIVGLSQPASIIAGPLLTLEVTQSGFGMYIKYLMAAFLGVYAISMAIQFSGYFLEGVADYRRDPGKRQLETALPQ